MREIKMDNIVYAFVFILCLLFCIDCGLILAFFIWRSSINLIKSRVTIIDINKSKTIIYRIPEHEYQLIKDDNGKVTGIYINHRVYNNVIVHTEKIVDSLE